MPPGSAFFDVAAAAYSLLGLFTLARLARSWRSLFDGDFTAGDMRLSYQVALFLLPPLYILAHEMGHYWAARAAGAQHVGLHYRVYWGYVPFQAGPALVSKSQVLAIQSAGPAVHLALALLTLAAGALVPRRAVWRHLLATAGLAQVLFVLALYPLIDLGAGWRDDFGQIYSLLGPGLRAVAAAVHVSLALAVLGVVALPRVRAALDGRPRSPARRPALEGAPGPVIRRDASGLPSGVAIFGRLAALSTGVGLAGAVGYGVWQGWSR